MTTRPPCEQKSSIGVDNEIYVICQTGTRSQIVAEMLRGAGFLRVVHVDGRTNAWVGAGSPMERSKDAGMSLERQVRIVTGLVVFVGVWSGFLLHPVGYVIAGAVGAGLAFSGFAKSIRSFPAAREDAVESHRSARGSGRAGIGKVNHV